ncbi:MAG: SDR family oxidoreductase [Baekduia sp.]
MSDGTILITGFPGFLAGRLLPLLRDQEPDARIVALVEPRMIERAHQLAPDGVELLAGDITDPLLGLGRGEYDALAAELRSVVHLAAIYDLAVGAELAEKVNVDGTDHILALCRAAPGLERHHYISTAYVAGLRSGRVMESELAEGQRHKNHYESTKFAAEVLVRASMDEIPTTIYRPGIVVGDSRTGETQKFDGPYYLLRAMDAGSGPLRAQWGKTGALMNVVPVDFVIEAILAGMREPSSAGETLHLVDPDPIDAVHMQHVLMREHLGAEPNVTIPIGPAAEILRLKLARRLANGVPSESLRYLRHPVVYDVSRATEILGRAGVSCPRFEDYAPAMVRFYEQHADDDAYRPAHER